MAPCPACGTENVADAVYCGSCGTTVGQLAFSPWPPPLGYLPPDMSEGGPRPRSGLPVAGGAVTIAGGGVGMASSIPLMFGVSFPVLGFANALCGFAGFTFGALAVLGGLLAIRRRQWGLALVGAILGLFSGGVLFFASILCFVGVVLIGLSDREFGS